VSSAHGLLLAPLSFDLVRSAPALLADVDWTWVEAEFEAMEAEGRAILARSGVAPEAVELRRMCDLRFHRQGAELPIAAEPGATPDDLAQAFHARYAALYRHVPADVPVEVISWRVIASSARPRTPSAARAAAGAPRKGVRGVYWGPSAGTVDTPVLDRGALRPGDRFDGPLIVEERESTTVVEPGCTLTIDDGMNLVIDLH
jgi:N-methylhydantoinase A